MMSEPQPIRLYELVDDPELKALICLEQAETILSELDGHDSVRESTTEVRSDLGEKLLSDATDGQSDDD